MRVSQIEAREAARETLSIIAHIDAVFTAHAAAQPTLSLDEKLAQCKTPAQRRDVIRRHKTASI